MNLTITTPAPFRDPILRAYLDDILEWHGYMRTLGLPTMKDNPSVPINRLYVAPALSTAPVSPDSKELGEGESILQILEEHRRLVVQGDPGSGKSTLVNWLAWRLAAGLSAPLPNFLEGTIPIPLILRELNPEGMESFDKLLINFLKRPVAHAFRQNVAPLVSALKEGRALVLVDGLDELPENQRKQLISSLRKAFFRYRKSIWLITSRVVGFDESILNLDNNENPSLEDAIKQRILSEGVPDAFHNLLQGKNLGDVLGAVVKPAAMEVGSQLLDELANRTESDHFGILLRNSLDKVIPDAERRPRRQIHRVYVMPFDDKRIESFSRAWYQIRGSARQESATCDNFLRSVRANQATHTLARNPQILTLMALVFRTRLDLPQGRALLYEYITQAYLESIDQAYGILDARFTWQEKKRLLSKVGYEMQFRRVSEKKKNKEKDSNSQKGILFSEKEVKKWIVEAMQGSRTDACDELASAFLDHISRRSGLLLPRGEGQYAFVHLTFQEYFAALYLRDEICSPEFVEDNAALDARITTETLYEWSGNTLWHETLLFLHELVGNTPRWAMRIESWIFRNPTQLSKESQKDQWYRLKLRVLVADDIHTGLNQETCIAAIRQACDSISEYNNLDLVLKSGVQREIFEVLCRSEIGSDCLLENLKNKPWQFIRLTDSGDNIQKILNSKAISENIYFLILENTGIQNLNWISSGYKNLTIFGFNEPHINNIEPITNCQNLKSVLIDCPNIEDINPLLKCKSIKDINIQNSRIKDLSSFISANDINITGNLSQIPEDQAEIFRERVKALRAKQEIPDQPKKNKKYYQRDRGLEATKPPKRIR